MRINIKDSVCYLGCVAGVCAGAVTDLIDRVGADVDEPLDGVGLQEDPDVLGRTLVVAGEVHHRVYHRVEVEEVLTVRKKRGSLLRVTLMRPVPLPP